LLVAVPIGRALDRRGELGFIAAGNILMAGCAVALAASDTPLPIFVLFGFHGLGHFMAAFATQPLLARFSHQGNYDQRFAAYSFAASVGQMLGPAIGGVLAGDGSHEGVSRAILASAAVAAILLVPLALARPPASSRPTPGAGASVRTTPPPSLPAILRMPDVVKAIVVSTTVLSAIDIIIIYLPALGEERLWSASLVGLLLAIRAGSSMTMRLVLGGLAARFDRRVLLIASMAVSAVALLAVPFVEPVAVVALLMVAAGAGLGVGQPLTMAWVAALAPPGMRATLLSVRVMGNSVGEVALPVVAGTVALIGGAAGVLAATGLITAVSLVWGFGRPRPPGGR
jgi:MFS family permease